MAETQPTMPKPPSRFHFGFIPGVLFRPRRTFEQIHDVETATWPTPMLALTLTGLIYVAVRGWLQTRAAMMGEVPLPADWQWWTPEMQTQYMQAQAATQGPVFQYVIPALGMLAGLWIGWVVVGGLLHLAFTMLGGRGSTGSAMTLVAWAWLPVGVRDLLRVIYMLIVQRVIQSPGLAGFAPAGEGSGPLFLGALLGLLDLFVVWQVALMVIGARATEKLSPGKALAAVLAVVIVILLVQAGMGALVSSLGGLMITRPFF
ncbi:MAG: Yip1 family protein [Anaerolineales bacterium]